MGKRVIRHHEKYGEHLWKRTKYGEIDNFAFEAGYHNGPVCTRCFFSFCEHCDPEKINDTNCVVDWDECPTCHKHVFEGDNYCRKCGQQLEWPIEPEEGR